MTTKNYTEAYRMLLASLQARITMAARIQEAFLKKLQDPQRAITSTLQWELDAVCEHAAVAELAGQLAKGVQSILDGTGGKVSYASLQKWLLNLAISRAANPYNGSGTGARIISAAEAKAAADLYQDLFIESPATYGEG